VLAGRWEHFTLLTEGLIARAVHLTDCFEFARASEEMRLIAERYEALANAFSDGYPELYPKGIHSDLRAKALGTWLQSEMLSAHPAGECLPRARRLSEAAAAEFKDEDDKQRQYQYRCQLETLAGEFAVAREFLGRSLSADPSHAAIAAAIGELADEPVQQGFALMHWLRLGSATLLAGEPAAHEARDFAEALETSNLAECSWCTGQHTFYPAHNILWRLATIYAAQGKYDGALRCVDVLHRLEPLKEKKVVLGALLLAAQAETAALLWESRPEAALKLLTSEEREQPGVKKLTSLLRSQTVDHFPGLTRLMESFASGVDDALGQEGAAERRKKLLALGQLVCY
jgi:tetratricopeptide (TPR) repeat protein